MMKVESSRVTRRRFLQSTIAGGVAVATAEAKPERQERESDREKLQRIAEECGSELGAVERVGR
jgi:hypothetical protein